MVTRCPVCASARIEPFLSRDDVPVHQNVLYPTAAAARAVARGQLRMSVCPQCGFVFNAAFDAGRITYERGYDNDQTFSRFFDGYVDSLVGRLAAEIGVDHRTIAEIGCGTGYFLNRVIAASAGSVGVGYDPSYTGQPRSADGRVSYVASPFTGDGQRADLVICRHVIEHVAQPLPFLASVRDNVDAGAAVVFETPSVEWILRNHVIWDFFYEHCSLYSAAALERVFAASRFEVRSVETVFNGQYLWLTARADGRTVGASVSPPDAAAAEVAGDCRRFAASEQRLRDRWHQAVENARARGPVAVWGAGAKGATFVSLLDPEAQRIACVVDVNPRKQGRHIAGTGHEVVGPEALAARGVATVMILNPNYETEIRSAAAAAGASVDFVTP